MRRRPIACGDATPHPVHGDVCHRPQRHKGRCYNIVTERHWGSPVIDSPVIHKMTRAAGRFRRRTINPEGEQWECWWENGTASWLPESFIQLVSEIRTDAEAVFTAPSEAIDQALSNEGLDPNALVAQLWKKMEELGIRKRLRR